MNRPGGTFDFALATPTGCRMGCDCDDCQMVAEDASSHPSSPHRSYLGPQTPVVPDLPVLHNLQMRLRRRLRLCWRSEGRRESDDWLDSLNDGPFTPRHSAGVRKRCKEELMSPPMSTDSPLLRYSIKSQTGGPKRSRALDCQRVREVCVSRMPSTLRERELPTEQLKAYDKAFASAWVGDDTVLVGTKCNRLIELNVRSWAMREIPFALRKSNPTVAQSILQDSTKCGIHSISVSPTGEYIATGSADPRHAVVLKVPSSRGKSASADYTHVQSMAGHADWVFGMAWITEKHVATCSKDSSIALWSVDDCGGHHTVTAPLLSRLDHRAKVRDMKFCFRSQMLSTVGADATVRLWDAKLQAIRTIKLDHNDELVCLEQREDVIAVGSQNHVMLIDPRDRKGSSRSIQTLEQNQSIRSLTLNEHLLTVGSGFGKISFYDLRAGSFTGWGEDSKTQMLEMGNGWLCPNSIFRDHFFLTPVQPACYSHCWDASRTRLFACGGPLAFGLVGCYMGIWE